MAARSLPSLDFPDVFQFLFRPKRYKVAYGGRGSSKSWSVARALIIRACESSERILCVRELQNSISESVHRLLCDQINLMGLGSLFEIQQQGIYRRPYDSKDRGSEFFFYGIKTNPTKVKSAEGITIAWVEEAEKVSKNSWEVLIPTIRQPGSEIWITFNPDEETDPTYQRFVVDPPPPEQCVSAFVNWHDNPWFPQVLREEKDYLARVDPDAYEHVWNGLCRKNGSSQIFRGKYSIQDFTPPRPDDCDKDNPMWDGPYFGADWGFSQDPVALTKSWIDNGTRLHPRKRLMVEYEAWGLGIETDDIPTLFKRVPGADKYKIRADSSRPETISAVSKKAFCENLGCSFTFNSKFMEPKCPHCGGKPKYLQVEAAEKWSGSVEDGVAYLKNFEQIIFHSRCTHHIEEARLYSYKVDRLTGDVLTDIVDKNNHAFDGLRYAHQPMIKATTSLGVWARL
jgi:phage terminase large subunit